MGKLELKLEGAKGWRHYLEGRSIHLGDLLELKFNDEWVAGHYVWSHQLNKRPLLCLNDKTQYRIWKEDLVRWVDGQDRTEKVKIQHLRSEEYMQNSLLRILVVDRFEQESNSLVELLSESGFKIHKASNGGEALVDARVFHPDVVLLGLNLPLVNGYAIAHCFREEYGTRLLIIALLNQDLEFDLQHARQSGFDTFIRKPVDLTALINLMNQIQV